MPSSEEIWKIFAAEWVVQNNIFNSLIDIFYVRILKNTNLYVSHLIYKRVNYSVLQQRQNKSGLLDGYNFFTSKPQFNADNV